MRTSIIALAVLTILALGSHPQAASETSDADSIIRDYLTEVNAQIGQNPRALGQDGVLEKFQELGEKHLLKNKAVLHTKAARDYLRMDVWKPKPGDTLKEFDGSAERLKQFESIYRKEGYGIPPFDRHAIATIWWEPHVAAGWLRDLCLKATLSKEEYQKRRFIEQFAAPRLYRQSDDPEKPIIAIFDGKELFVVKLVYFDTGIYALEKIEWSVVNYEN